MPDAVSENLYLLNCKTLRKFHQCWQGGKYDFYRLLKTSVLVIRRLYVSELLSIRYVFTEARACLKKSYCVRRQHTKTFLRFAYTNINFEILDKGVSQ